MADYYKRLEPLGSMSQSGKRKTVIKISASKSASSNKEKAVPIPQAKPTEGQRLKAMAREHQLNIPKDIDLDQNLARSRKFDLIPTDFYHQVKAEGPWDYKHNNPQYENFGNYHYGLMGKAAGIKEETLLRMAGWAHQRPGEKSLLDFVEGIPSFLGIGGRHPYGDDPKDQYWIRKGMEDYRRLTGSNVEVPLYLRSVYPW